MEHSLHDCYIISPGFLDKSEKAQISEILIKLVTVKDSVAT
jgi:hypothetical protein